MSPADKFEKIIYPLLWMAGFFGAGIFYQPFMPLAILVVVLLAVYVVSVVLRRLMMSAHPIS